VSRPWRRKFADAGRGLKVAAGTQSSVRAHLAAAALVVAAAAGFGCSAGEWAVLLLSAGMVLTAELLNTAVELLFRGLPQADRDRVFHSLDVAAGAVLVASLFAAAVGLVVLGPKLWAAVRTVY
jgi:diacylglycerol kinase